MDEEVSSDVQKNVSDGPMDTDEGPLINENSNGLSHLLTEGEFSSVDAGGVDESSASNQGFLNALSSGDYLTNNTGFDAEFDVGDNAVNFPSDSLNNVLSDNDSRISNTAEYKTSSGVEDVTESQPTQIDGVLDEGTEDNGQEPASQLDSKITTDNENDSKFSVEAEFSMDDEQSQSNQQTTDEVAEAGKEVTSENGIKTVAQDNNSVGATVDTNEAQEKIDTNDVQEKSDAIDEQKKTDANDIQEKMDTNEIQEKADTNDVQEKSKKENTKTSEVRGAEETEVVSEDELPTVEKPSIKDAENVSDDELPGPKPAELPADTEVVSEDELPSSKKDTKETRKRKNDEDDKDNGEAGSPSSESKKQAVAKDGESKPVPAEKRPSTDEKPKKKLPELDKYWKVVNDDPTDFTGWTYLLQYVDQESDVEAAREAYDAFLSHYPYCYGYWRKYADYEKRKGSKKKCLEVLERGLKSIPLSVDLWIHYLNHVKSTRADDHAYVRSQYERAIEACGLEFRSDRLWESYIKWEGEHGTPQLVTTLYDRLLATPTLGYTTHFDNFQEHVMSEAVTALVPRAELVRLRAEVRESSGTAPILDLPPGEDEPPDHIASEEEGQAIKERIIAIRRKVHKVTGEEVAARWTFEEGIKRPYFHVKPLERCQLKNWKAYLEWEQQNGSLQRALVLHERCLIACALYHEFWMRLIKFLEEKTESNPELVAVEREVLERACTVHHLDKPELHLHWAHFEEAQGNPSKAAEILDRIEKACPSVVQIQYRRVNLERRRGRLYKCASLYEGYIAGAKSKAIASALAIKYARFLHHLRNDPAAARKVLDEAIVKDPLNQRLHLQRLDLALNTPGVEYPELEELVCSYEKQPGAELEARASMAWRWRELAEELGSAAASHAATNHAHSLAKHLRKRTRKEKQDAATIATAAAGTDITSSEYEDTETDANDTETNANDTEMDDTETDANDMEMDDTELESQTSQTPKPQNKKTFTPRKLCSMCKKKGHTSDKCPYMLCLKCKLPGHKAKNCRNKKIKGHMSKDQPEKAEVICHRCKQLGHKIKNCETNCRNKKTKGHMSKDQPEKAEVICHRCKQPGHKIKNCKTNCRNKKIKGHMSKDQLEKAEVICHRCKQPGHKIKNCETNCRNKEIKGHMSKDQPEKAEVICHRCKQPGHKIKNCETNCRNKKIKGHMSKDQPEKAEVICRRCKQPGHKVKNCETKLIKPYMYMDCPEHVMCLKKQFGHWVQHCRNKRAPKVHKNSREKADGSLVTCFKCNLPGHKIQNCSMERISKDCAEKADGM